MSKTQKVLLSVLIGVIALVAGARATNPIPITLSGLVVTNYTEFNHKNKITETVFNNMGMNLPKRDHHYRITLTISELDPNDIKHPVLRKQTLRWYLEPVEKTQ